jgi:hypothetical protein
MRSLLNDMPTPAANSRWFRVTPDRCVLGLLALEAFLLLSQWFQWFPFNEHKGWSVLIAVAIVGAFFVLMFLWFVLALVFRWRFQFSILCLLLLFVVVAVPCSWLATEMKAARKQREAVAAIEKAGGKVGYDYEPDPYLVPDAEPPGPAWLRKLLGNDLFVSVTVASIIARDAIGDAELEFLEGLPQLQELELGGGMVSGAGLGRIAELPQIQRLVLAGTDVSDAGLQRLKGLTRLQSLDLESTNVSDAGLQYLEGMTRLQELELDETRVGDAGLEHLRGLTQLDSLDLTSTEVTDAGLEHLKGLTQLRNLTLRGTRVSDAGLEHLEGLIQLNLLHLERTKVTNAGVKKLRQALPGCQIDQ